MLCPGRGIARRCASGGSGYTNYGHFVTVSTSSDNPKKDVSCGHIIVTLRVSWPLCIGVARWRDPLLGQYGDYCRASVDVDYTRLVWDVVSGLVDSSFVSRLHEWLTVFYGI